MRKLLISAVAMTVAALLLAPVASAIDDVNTQRLRNGVTTSSILNHMRAFQRVANANDGNRAANTTGYDASLAYVERRMNRAGYETKRVPFEYFDWVQNGASVLQREGSPPYLEGTATAANDYYVAFYSGSGNVAAPVVTTGTAELPPSAGPGNGTDGCLASDWAGRVLTGNVALVQRGGCDFVVKIAVAKLLGAAAVLIFNDGGPTDREEPFQLAAEPNETLPVAMLSNNAGEALYTAAQAGPVNVTFNVSTTTTEVEEENLIADTPTGNPERTTVVGAHLDSVPEGPGINDNGSGSGTILEIAEEIAELPRNPRNRLRFAWWGAEETGIIGSGEYVAGIDDSGEIDNIEANLNFDMLASPNFVRFVYDGDNSSNAPGAEVGPPGSAEIEQVFLDHFESVGLDTEPTGFDGRSDYGPFIAPEAYVAAGGLFSGAEEIKTPEQEEIYGGAAGSWYDPCYHEPCDTFSTIVYQPPLEAAGLEPGTVEEPGTDAEKQADADAMRGNGLIGLGQLADGAADATWTLARSRSPLVGPADARVASVGNARRKYRRAYRRAAKERTHKGGLVIR